MTYITDEPPAQELARLRQRVAELERRESQQHYVRDSQGRFLPVQPSAAQQQPAQPLTEADLQGKSHEWINQNWDRIVDSANAGHLDLLGTGGR